MSKWRLTTILATERDRIDQGQRDSPTVQFGRQEFLEVVYTEKPRIIYRADGVHFFFLVGLKVCTKECENRDFMGILLLPWLAEGTA